MKDFFANHKKVCIISASAAVALIVTVGILALTFGKSRPETDNVSDNVTSSEPTSSITVEVPKDEDTSSNAENSSDNSISPNESEADNVLTENSSTSNPQEPAQKPSTSSGSGTASSEPAQPSQPSTGSGNTTVTTPGRPSDAFLEAQGLTYEQFQANVEAAKTCPLCGQSTGGKHHLYGRDMNCYDCGAPCKANTCHWCE